MKVVCIFCGKTIQDGSLAVCYAVCDECKNKISEKLGMEIDTVVVQGGSDEKEKA